jgi:L-amino acid N-acyltransferase YncA
MKKIKIVKAKIEDAQKIRILETKVWAEECTNKYDIPMYIRFGYVYVAKEGNRIIGAICSYKTKDNKVYVCDWFVDNKYRGKSIGMKLYKKLISSVKFPIVTFLDPARIPTVKAHEKLGFKLLKKVKNAYGINKGLEKGERLLVILKK